QHQSVDFVKFFFFQAEDGIRDRNVTGVQTCALPISPRAASPAAAPRAPVAARGGAAARRRLGMGGLVSAAGTDRAAALGCARLQIGRASCRGRGEMWVLAVAVGENEERRIRGRGETV